MGTQEEPQGTIEHPGIRPGSWILLILVLLALMVVAWVWIRMPPRYHSSAALFLESPSPKLPLDIDDPLLAPEMMERFVADEAVLLKDPSVLREVLEANVVRETDWFGSQPGAEEALEALKDSLSVERIPNTSYLMISFGTKTPNDAAIIVNTVIGKYLARVHRISRETYRGELQTYEQTEGRLQEQIERIRAQKESFVSSLGVPGVMEGLNVVGRTWLQLAEEATRLEAEKLQYQAAYDNLRGGDPSTIEIAITPDMRAIIEQDPRIAQLRDKKLALELELEANLPETPENKEALHTLSKQLEVVDRKLIELVAEREEELRAYQLHAAKTMYLNAAQAVLQLQERMLELEAEQRDLDRGLAQYRNLEEEQVLLEDRRGRILDYISQLRMMVEARDLVRVRRVGEAYPAQNLDSDVQILVTAAALAVPVAFGILLLVVRAARRPRVA